MKISILSVHAAQSILIFTGCIDVVFGSSNKILFKSGLKQEKEGVFQSKFKRESINQKYVPYAEIQMDFANVIKEIEKTRLKIDQLKRTADFEQVFSILSKVFAFLHADAEDLYDMAGNLVSERFRKLLLHQKLPFLSSRSQEIKKNFVQLKEIFAILCKKMENPNFNLCSSFAVANLFETGGFSRLLESKKSVDDGFGVPDFYPLGINPVLNEYANLHLSNINGITDVLGKVNMSLCYLESTMNNFSSDPFKKAHQSLCVIKNVIETIADFLNCNLKDEVMGPNTYAVQLEISLHVWILQKCHSYWASMIDWVEKRNGAFSEWNY